MIKMQNCEQKSNSSSKNLLWCKFWVAAILVASARGFQGKSNVDIKNALLKGEVKPFGD